MYTCIPPHLQTLRLRLRSDNLGGGFKTSNNDTVVLSCCGISSESLQSDRDEPKHMADVVPADTQCGETT